MEDSRKYACLVLYTAQSGIAQQKHDQDQLFRLLQAHRIGYDVVDGATASNKDLRTRLFDVAKKGVKYPLVFFRDLADPEKFSFVADYQTVHKWNEQNDITKTFSTKFKSVLNTAVAAPVDRSSDGSPEWVAAVTDDGDKYWFNKHTGETSWTPPLRPGENPWTALKDEEGDTYYFNRETQETSWETPPGFSDSRSSSAAKPAAGAAAPSPAAAAAAAGAEEDAPEGFTGDVGNLSDWEQFSDDEGDPYWHNSSTDASSWFPPPGWEEHLAKRGGR